MNHNKQDIPFLDEKSKQIEISTILTKGLDPKASFWNYLATMYKQIGFRFIFKDLTEILFALVTAMMIIGALIINTTDLLAVKNLNLYTIIFIWSPMTYLLMAYFFFIHQKQRPTYDIEMTCKYNLHQLAAFRMLLFGLISIVTNSLLIFALSLFQDIHYFYAFLLSSASLFLFSIIFLYVQFHTKTRKSKVTLLLIWLTGNLIASYYSTVFYMNFLSNIPFFIYGVIAIGCVVLYVKGLKRFLFTEKMKGWI